MKESGNPPSRLSKSSLLLGILAVGFVVAIYSNTFSIPWKLDDLPNIVTNSRLHLTSMDPASLRQAFSASPKGGSELYRPIACLSFALNWYFGADHVFGYHAVNLAVHLATALFLYLTLLKLHASPALAGRFEKRNVYSIALLAAVFWAANPAQTQAVNYIVQRMATLATLFSILSIYFYVSGRLSATEYRSGACYLACAAGFVLALGSKENAAILPLSLALIEIVFFQAAKSSQKKHIIIGVTFMAAVGVIVVAYFFYDLNPLFFLKGYNGRPFSLSERLLTEARILVFYLSQLFYPHPARLSMVHDFEISRSLFEPWTTSAAILLIVALIGLSLKRIRQNPVISFTGLFFFLNHLVESTVIPLELVFEHRNYLPSLFLFWPVAIGFHDLLVRFRHSRRLRYGILALVPLVLIGFGLGTYQRNEVWKTDQGFWEDALQKAPQSRRPYQQLATYYQNRGRFDKALQMLEQSQHLKDENPRMGQIVYYNNMGDLMIQLGRYDQAIEYLEALLAVEPGHRIGRGNLIVALMKGQRWHQASAQIDYLLKKQYDNYRYPNLKGAVLVRLNHLAEAQQYFRQALYMAPLARETLINFCGNLNSMGEIDRAHTCLTRALQFHPEDPSLLIRLVENCVRDGRIDEARFYLDSLQAGSRRSVSKMLAEESHNIFLVPPSAALVLSALDTYRQPDVMIGKQREFEHVNGASSPR
jgi:Tfp pilus assembly protein PilF